MTESKVLTISNHKRCSNIHSECNILFLCYLYTVCMLRYGLTEHRQTIESLFVCLNQRKFCHSYSIYRYSAMNCLFCHIYLCFIAVLFVCADKSSEQSCWKERKRQMTHNIENHQPQARFICTNTMWIETVVIIHKMTRNVKKSRRRCVCA